MKNLLPLLFFLVLFSCKTAHYHAGTPLPVDVPEPGRSAPDYSGSGGVVEEIRFLTEKGSPSSLLRAGELIRSRGVGSTEFGRLMNNVNASLMKTIYPAIQANFLPPDPPVTHVYSRIIKDAESGLYRAPPLNSADYLECVLPFLALYPRAGAAPVYAENYLSALPDLERAGKLNEESFLAGFFTGIVYEMTRQLDSASAKFSEVWERFPESYPAALGIARVMEAQGRTRECVQFLSDLAVEFPGNIQVKRQLALVYYRSGDWPNAEAAIAEVLNIDSRDGEFLLMNAHVLVEQGQLFQAQAPLDNYAAYNPSSRLYLFLRARVQAEAYNNRDAALNFLRTILRSATTSNSFDEEATVYAARLLMESSRAQEQNEGREMLRKLLESPNPSLEVTGLALNDAVRREDWLEAQNYLDRLLEERRSAQDLLAAYTLEREQGNIAAALSYARELYEKDRSSEEGIVTYISALIDSNRNDEAVRLIEGRIDNIAGGVLKGRYFYLRSMTRRNEELAMSDLRSSLFEDPRNLNSLIALFEIYRRRDDERRAVYYLRQALALAPDNLRLKRYEAEYAAALNGLF